MQPVGQLYERKRSSSIRLRIHHLRFGATNQLLELLARILYLLLINTTYLVTYYITNIMMNNVGTASSYNVKRKN